MKCQDCKWLCITDIEKAEDWEKLDIANWNKSIHVATKKHTVRIHQEVDYRIRRIEKK